MKKKGKPRKPSTLELRFVNLWKDVPIPYVREYTFHPRRAWRFDFAFPTRKVAIEIQGFGKGHNSYSGMKSDYEKHNEALKLGWIIIYLMGIDLKEKNRETTKQLILTILKSRKSIV
ncbi:MAG: hypothetical protein KatS3mg087_1404 [Patescibacteria group bacterium]|nr:MAG: hypothetical protein KatS3mg087_1404 [Patescibacteria group bacterium]